ncbi:MAG TPA: class I SAM-dependent methyltransferase [Actinomycetota bacterium]
MSEPSGEHASTTPCVVCGAAARDAELTLDSWTILRCERCGLRTLWPPPETVRMEEFDDGSGYEGAFALRDELLARHDRSLAAMERHVPPGRLLDVGCGPGFLLEAARERGWKPVGVDPSPYGVARAREAGFEAHEGMVEEIELESESFDALALLQVIEHVPDPRPLLATCRGLLRDGGVLLVATPNPASLLARIKRERFNYWIPPMHCAWYPPATLARAIRAAGFGVLERTTWSARTAALHDGIDVLTATRAGRALPVRVRRALGDAVAGVADGLGYGSIVELIARKG